nr:YceH family protein [Thioalkalivibrio sp.]
MSEHQEDTKTEEKDGLPLNPPLDAEEARVLGCLIEKESATPEVYPLTQNAAVTACNQKTSRNPVMQMDPGRVGWVLRRLEERGLVKSDFGARATRYAHRADPVLNVSPGQRTLIGLLLLRGPQTLAELFTRSERLHRFNGLDDVQDHLDALAARDEPMVVRLPRGPGQREDRYMHLLCGKVEETAPGRRPAASPTGETVASGNLAEKVIELERRIEALERRLGEAED